MPYSTNVNGIIAAVFCIVLPAVVMIAYFFDVRRRRASAQTPPARKTEQPKPCPRCGYDLRASGKRCPECGVLVWSRTQYLWFLAHEWPSNDIKCREVAASELAMTLVTAGTPQEANLLRDQLRARGIPAFVNRRDKSDLFLSGGTVSDSTVQVYAADFVEASDFLRRLRGLPNDVEESVPADW